MHVAITGASSGIGRGLAVAFSKAGHTLSLVARRAPLLEALATDLETESHLAVVDLSVPERSTEWIAAAEAALGPIDVLVNNAGMQIIGRTAEVDVEEGERLLRLNVFTPMRLTRHLLPAMTARGSGTIVDIASAAALAPTPGMFYYNASKAALAAASEALRGELRETGVHVVTVYPGIIAETDMGRKGLEAYESSTLERLQPRGEIAELAALVVRAVAEGEDRVIYPRFNALARAFPGFTRWAMDHFTPPLKDRDKAD